MSVINDMLRDLDERDAPEYEQVSDDSRCLVAQAPTSFWQSKFFDGLLVVIIVLLGILVWAQFQPSESQAALPQAPVLETPVPETPVPATAERKPSTVENSLVNAAEEALAEDRQAVEPAHHSQTELTGQPADDDDSLPVGDTAPATAEPGMAGKMGAEAVASSHQPAADKAQLPSAMVDSKSQAGFEAPARQSASQSSPEVESQSPVTAAAVTAVTRAKNTSSARLEGNASPSAAGARPQSATGGLKPRSFSLQANKAVSANGQGRAIQDKGVRLTPEAIDQAEAQRLRQLYAAGEHGAANQLAYRFIAGHQQHQYTQLLLATQLVSQRDTPALADLLSSVDRDSIAPLRMLKAQWYGQNGQLEQAVEMLAWQLPEVATQPDYHALLASYYQQSGRNHSAVERYSQLLEHDANNASWWVGMAISLDRLKRYSDARLAYRQALAIPQIEASLAQFSSQRLEQLGAGGR